MTSRARLLLALAALGLTVGVLVSTRMQGQNQRREQEPPARHPARGTHGAIAAGTDYATEAGMRIYWAGGNAVDAGVAAMFAAAVTEYSHFGFGGEAPILIRTKTGKVVSIAGVGTMPKAANLEFFRNRKPKPGEVQWLEPNGLKGFVPAAGLMPALVPGMVEAGLVALREYGTKSFEEIIAPAIELADGAPLDELRASTIRQGRRFFELWPDSKAVFIGGATQIRTGAIFRQKNLARTMRAMAGAERGAKGGREARIDAVRDYFYRGEIARKISAFMEENDGLLRYEDMAAFRLKPEEPVCSDYRGYQICKPGFWSQGPSMIQALNMLTVGYGAGQPPALNSAAYLHQMTEMMKLVYADRDTYYGDPAFNKLPAATLLSAEYAAERWKQIGARASLEFQPGLINGQRGKHPSEADVTMAKIDDALMAKDTTSVDAIDKDGLMFSATPSGAWLPSVIAGDTGIPMTQRGQTFFLIPGHPNELAGGKRPRVTLSPTIVTQGGKPVLALSTPGGDNQEQSQLQILLNVIHFGMNAQQAIELPRFQTRHLVSSFDNHSMNPGDLLLDERTPANVIGELQERGHKIQMRSKWNSGAAPVMVRVAEDGVLEAGSDPYAYRSARAW